MRKKNIAVEILKVKLSRIRRDHKSRIKTGPKQKKTTQAYHIQTALNGRQRENLERSQTKNTF